MRIVWLLHLLDSMARDVIEPVIQRRIARRRREINQIATLPIITLINLHRTIREPALPLLPLPRTRTTRRRDSLLKRRPVVIRRIDTLVELFRLRSPRLPSSA